MRNDSRRNARRKLNNFRAQIQIVAPSRDDVYDAARHMGVYLRTVVPMPDGKFVGEGSRVIQRNKLDTKFIAAIHKLLDERKGVLSFKEALPLLRAAGAPVAPDNVPHALESQRRMFEIQKRQWQYDQKARK